MQFRVRPESLLETARALRETLTFVGDWNRQKSDLIASAPQAGHLAMSDAIEQFNREWGYGFGHIAHDLEEIATALEAAAAAYIETDQAMADTSGVGG